MKTPAHRRKKDPFRKQILGVRKLPPPKPKDEPREEEQCPPSQ